MNRLFLAVALVAFFSASAIARVLECDVEQCLNSESPSIGGHIYLTEDDDQVTVHAYINGMAKYSIHGFHLHEDAVEGIDCGTAGGHFNPNTVDHACPDEVLLNRHVGDMGNIQADVNGEAWFVKSFDLLSLDAAEGRSIIIHQSPDKCSEFQSSGDAGSRAGYCTLKNSAAALAGSGVLVLSFLVALLSF